MHWYNSAVQAGIAPRLNGLKPGTSPESVQFQPRLARWNRPLQSPYGDCHLPVTPHGLRFTRAPTHRASCRPTARRGRDRGAARRIFEVRQGGADGRIDGYDTTLPAGRRGAPADLARVAAAGVGGRAGAVVAGLGRGDRHVDGRRSSARPNDARRRPTDDAARTERIHRLDRCGSTGGGYQSLNWSAGGIDNRRAIGYNGRHINEWGRAVAAARPLATRRVPR